MINESFIIARKINKLYVNDLTLHAMCVYRVCVYSVWVCDVCELENRKCQECSVPFFGHFINIDYIILMVADQIFIHKNEFESFWVLGEANFNFISILLTA